MRVVDNDGVREFVVEDAGTTTIVYPFQIGHNSTGTPASEFGVGIRAQSETSTTPNTNLGVIEWYWRNATHASRRTEVAIGGYTDSGRGNLLMARAPADFGLALSAINTIGAGSADLHSRKDNAANVAAGQYSFLGPGLDNSLSGDYSLIVGGSGITVTGNRSAVIGGNGTTVSGYFSVDLAGLYNSIAADHAVTFGSGVSALLDFGFYFGNGNFAATGDNQTMFLNVWRSVTHSTTAWYQLYIDGTGDQLTVPLNSVWTFDILISGATTGLGKSFGFRIEGTIENDGGTTTLLASTVTTIYDTDDTSFDARVSADDANDALLVEVSDSDGASDTVRWSANLRIVAVVYP